MHNLYEEDLSMTELEKLTLFTAAKYLRPILSAAEQSGKTPEEISEVIYDALAAGSLGTEREHADAKALYQVLAESDQYLTQDALADHFENIFDEIVLDDIEKKYLHFLSNNEDLTLLHDRLSALLPQPVNSAEAMKDEILNEICARKLIVPYDNKMKKNEIRNYLEMGEDCVTVTLDLAESFDRLRQAGYYQDPAMNRQLFAGILYANRGDIEVDKKRCEEMADFFIDSFKYLGDRLMGPYYRGYASTQSNQLRILDTYQKKIDDPTTSEMYVMFSRTAKAFRAAKNMDEIVNHYATPEQLAKMDQLPENLLLDKALKNCSALFDDFAPKSAGYRDASHKFHHFVSEYLLGDYQAKFSNDVVNFFTKRYSPKQDVSQLFNKQFAKTLSEEARRTLLSRLAADTLAEEIGLKDQLAEDQAKKAQEEAKALEEANQKKLRDEENARKQKEADLRRERQEAQRENDEEESRKRLQALLDAADEDDEDENSDDHVKTDADPSSPDKEVKEEEMEVVSDHFEDEEKGGQSFADFGNHAEPSYEAPRDPNASFDDKKEEADASLEDRKDQADRSDPEEEKEQPSFDERNSLPKQDIDLFDKSADGNEYEIPAKPVGHLNAEHYDDLRAISDAIHEARSHTSHDSRQYRTLDTDLKALTDKLKDQKSSQVDIMDSLQAVSKDIDAYMRHKLRSGINGSKDERKLVWVEKLADYITSHAAADDYSYVPESMRINFDNGYMNASLQDTLSGHAMNRKYPAWLRMDPDDTKLSLTRSLDKLLANPMMALDAYTERSKFVDKKVIKGMQDQLDKLTGKKKISFDDLQDKEAAKDPKKTAAARTGSDQKTLAKDAVQTGTKKRH